jgi:hypothetical protein
MSQERSVPAGFVVGGLVTILSIPIFARLRSLNEPADRITADVPEATATPLPALGVEDTPPVEAPVRGPR